MSKGESQFADASQIDYLLKKELPERINALNKNVNDRTKYVAGMTDLHSTLDIAHPFREGNGRATIKELQAEKVTKIEIEIARKNLASTSMKGAEKNLIK